MLGRQSLGESLADAGVMMLLLGLNHRQYEVQAARSEALLTERSDVDGVLRPVRRSGRLTADEPAETCDAVAALRQDVPPLTESLAAAAPARDHGLTVAFEADRDTRPLTSAPDAAEPRTERRPARRPQRPRGLHPDR